MIGYISYLYRWVSQEKMFFCKVSSREMIHATEHPVVFPVLPWGRHKKKRWKTNLGVQAHMQELQGKTITKKGLFRKKCCSSFQRAAPQTA